MAVDRWEHVFVLFDGALAQPDTERDAFLASECGDDERLREDVQALLAAHEEAQGSFPAVQLAPAPRIWTSRDGSHLR